MSFIHRSIKTRIETRAIPESRIIYYRVLYIDPLKQGLKLSFRSSSDSHSASFIHRSIKTRIETFYIGMRYITKIRFIHRSIKTRIETYRLSDGAGSRKEVLYIDPLKQGLKL